MTFGRLGSLGRGFGGLGSGGAAAEPLTDLANLPGLIRAWRFDEGVTLNVADVASVAGAWGTSEALAPPGANAPSILADLGPQNQDICEFTSANSDVLGFTSAAPDDFTVFIAAAPKSFTGSGIGGLICRTNNVNGYIGIKGAAGAEVSGNFQARAIGSALTDVPAPVNINKNFQIFALHYVKSTGIMTPWVNKIKGSGVSVGTGGFAFDRIGAAGNAGGVTGFFNGFMGAALLSNQAIGDATIEQATDLLAALWRGSFRIATDGSDSSVTPWNASTPFATFAKVKAALPQRGDTVYAAPGEYREPLETASAGVASLPIQWRTTANVSARPTSLLDTDLVKLIGGTQVTSGWGTLSANVQTRTRATKPKKMYVVLVDGTVVHLFDRATDQNFSFAHAATTLTARYDGVTDLNTLVTEIVADDTTQDGIEVAHGYNEFYGFDLRHWGRSGLDVAGTTPGVRFEYGILGYNPADGWDTSGASNLTIKNSWIIGNGVNRTTAGSDGDGGSCHGPSAADSEGNLYQDNMRSNLGHERSATFTSTNDTLEGGNQNFIIYDQSATGSETGTFTIDGMDLTRTADDQVDGVHITSGIENTVSVTITNSDFTDEAAGGGKAINNASNAVLTQTGNTQTGFASLT